MSNSVPRQYVPHLKEKIDFFLFCEISKCGVRNFGTKSICESAIDEYVRRYAFKHNIHRKLITRNTSQAKATANFVSPRRQIESGACELACQYAFLTNRLYYILENFLSPAAGWRYHCLLIF